MQAFVASSAERQSERFTEDVRRGLSHPRQKWIPPTYLYDEIGSALFDAITLLPEYGLTRADEILLKRHAREIAALCGSDIFVVELGSGSGAKTRGLLQALGSRTIKYYPIDVSGAALDRCVSDLDRHAEVRPVQASYIDGLRRVVRERNRGKRMLLLFLGSTIGNFDRAGALAFLQHVRAVLSSGDRMLIGADLVKPVAKLIAAYDDSLGVTAAFNRNLLARMNRDLGADFDLHGFSHEVRWCPREERIEMHLRADYRHTVHIPAAGLEVRFRSGETVWTESSHKFTTASLDAMAVAAGFRTDACWTNREWPFAECLWSV